MKYVYMLIPFLWVQSALAQLKLPVIKATSKSASIKDGNYLDNGWTLSPKIKPDVYTADRTRKTKLVTFYTDIDSIKVKVKPGTRFNFMVLLNGKDSCYTQIASAIPPESRLKSRVTKNDTIPFSLTSYNAIKVKAVINNIDTLNLHFDVSSFGFHLTQDAILKKTRLLSNQPDALAGRAKPNYNKLNKTSKLQIGTVVWNNPEILPTGVTAHEMDGRFGWDLFEGKNVEIDYDHNVLIIRSKLPKSLKGYTRSKIAFIHSLACLKGTFEIEKKNYTGYFSMDTGSEQAIILDSTWASKQNFPQNLSLIKSSVLSDARGEKYEIKTVLTPIFKIGNFKLANIPTISGVSINSAPLEINYLGNDLLKRFNMVLDFKTDLLYLKPNKLFNLKFRNNA